MNNRTPTINTSVIPGYLLIGSGELARSVATLDNLDSKGSREHHDAVMQVINDAKSAGYNIIVN